jgi:RimJ/RimL family protein N-acetyltransferase
MKHDYVIEGSAVRLCPLTENDVPLLARWLFDPDILHWLQLSEDPPQLRTLEAVQERHEQMQADPFSLTWRIDSRAGQPIGQIELVDIRRLQGRAEMHLLIGEKTTWGGGHGTDAIRQVSGFAFRQLSLRRIFATPDADNARVLRVFEKCGFVREGLLRQHRLRHGIPTDMYVMCLLRDDDGLHA